MPATVTIPAGQMSVSFDVTLVDNGLRTGPQTETLTATAAGLPTAQGSIVVDDADVDHFGFNPISSPEVAGLPFLVTVQAYDILNNPIAVYSQTVALAAMGSSGTISVDPTTVTFANGVWTGDVTVGATIPR